MDDEEFEFETVEPYVAVKHNKWTFIALGVDLMANVAREISETLDTTTTAIGQYRQHKIEEEKFHEITRGM